MEEWAALHRAFRDVDRNKYVRACKNKKKEREREKKGRNFTTPTRALTWVDLVFAERRFFLCRIVYQRISRACTCTPTNPRASRRRESPRWKGGSRSRRREESHSRYDVGIRVPMALRSAQHLSSL